MSKTQTTATGATVTEGKCSVEITSGKAYGEDRTEWTCCARIGGDYHTAFANKSYRSFKAAEKAADKWVTAKAAQLAAEEATYERTKDMGTGGPTPAWLERVYEQWETSNVATVKWGVRP